MGQIKRKGLKTITIPEQKTDHIQMSSIKVAKTANHSAFELLPKNGKDALRQLQSSEERDIKQTFKQALKLENSFPGNSAVLSYIAHLAITMRKSGIYKKYIKKNFELNQTHLLARINYAHLLLIDKKPQEALDLFYGCKDLTKFAPERTLFYYDEVVAFLQFLGNLAVDCKRLEEAEQYHYILHFLDSDGKGTAALGRRVGMLIGKKSLFTKIRSFFRN